MRDRTRYNRVLKALAQQLPGPNKGLYVLILRDLLFHFDNNKYGVCRSKIFHKSEPWNADSYDTITDRINKKLDPKVSVKTVKRYHDHLDQKGWIKRCRKFFYGKSVLHRRLHLTSFEAAITIANFVSSNQENAQLKQTLDEQKKRDLLSGKSITGIAASCEDPAGIDRFVEETIEYGELLFRLGRLTETHKRVTQRARARIKRLVEAKILGPLFLLCIKEAIDHGEFDNQGIKLDHKFWPNWLDTFYPEEGANPTEGILGSYFIGVKVDDIQWMNSQRRENYQTCQRLFEEYGKDIDSAAEQRKFIKDEKVISV